MRTFGANFYIGSALEHGLPTSAFETVEQEAPSGLIEAGSPYLYGAARTELEKVVLVGVTFETLKPLVPYWQVEGQ